MHATKFFRNASIFYIWINAVSFPHTNGTFKLFPSQHFKGLLPPLAVVRVKSLGRRGMAVRAWMSLTKWWGQPMDLCHQPSAARQQWPLVSLSHTMPVARVSGITVWPFPGESFLPRHISGSLLYASLERSGFLPSVYAKGAYWWLLPVKHFAQHNAIWITRRQDEEIRVHSTFKVHKVILLNTENVTWRNVCVLLCRKSETFYLRPWKYIPLSNKIERTFQLLAWKVGKRLKSSYRVLLFN